MTNERHSKNDMKAYIYLKPPMKPFYGQKGIILKFISEWKTLKRHELLSLMTQKISSTQTMSRILTYYEVSLVKDGYIQVIHKKGILEDA